VRVILFVVALALAVPLGVLFVRAVIRDARGGRDILGWPHERPRP
jgi:hypothetical protein